MMMMMRLGDTHDQDSWSARWSPWSAWSACSAACGAGTQTRAWRCRGTHCVGDNVQSTPAILKLRPAGRMWPAGPLSVARVP
ncbi:unnamed protein product [Plutella xylostella]|uniref:(diamondback moth) hypothetical protein n=1 Tax=Plutella xylostella TaxID=51655 RepID=A0A8S4FME8_PLUXY|nr:unnamed protein product [Plutella xylostella]